MQQQQVILIWISFPIPEELSVCSRHTSSNRSGTTKWAMLSGPSQWNLPLDGKWRSFNSIIPIVTITVAWLFNHFNACSSNCPLTQIRYSWVLRLLYRQLHGMLFARKWCCVAWCRLTNASNVPTASTFKVEELCRHSEEGNSKSLRNVSKFQPESGVKSKKTQFYAESRFFLTNCGSLWFFYLESQSPVG